MSAFLDIKLKLLIFQSGQAPSHEEGLPRLPNTNGSKSQASTASSSATRDSGISLNDQKQLEQQLAAERKRQQLMRQQQDQLARGLSRVSNSSSRYA